MKKVLVIEDELSLREDIIDILRLAKFEVLGAENGIIGVEATHRFQPDLIICDIMMPGKTGTWVLEQVRSNPRTAMIPFIFLTAKSHRHDIRQGMELGADDYIPKPFVPDELLRAIRAQFARQQALVQNHERRLEELRHNIIRALPHELRTPMTVIMGHTRMLIEDAETLQPSEVLQMASGIRRSAVRMNRLMENHLIYAQLELMTLQPDKLPDISQLCTSELPVLLNALVTQKGQDSKRSADLHLDCEEASINISPQDFEKIVFELLDNAIKFSQPGQPILIQAGPHADGDFRLRITDHGRGMAPQQIEDIGAYMQFERRFYEHPGLGLGLTIAIRLVEMYGGSLQIQSRNGQTTVEISLALCST